MKSSSRQQFDKFRLDFRTGNLPDEHDDASPGKPAPKTKPKWSYLRFYFEWLKPDKSAIVLVFLLALGSALLGLIPPYATKLIIDQILHIETSATGAIRQSTNLYPAGAGMLANIYLWWNSIDNESRLHWAGGAILAVLVLQQAIEALRTHRTNLLNFKVLRRLQQRLFNHLLRLPIHELQQMKTGGIVTRLGSDLDDISGLLQMAVITPAVAAFRVVATMGILVLIQWRMALIAVLLLVPIVIINIQWIKKLKPLHRSVRRDRGEVNARVVETFGGLPVVRVFRRERKEARDFAVGQNLIIRKRLFTRLYYLAISTAWGLLLPLSSLLIIWYGGTRYLVGQLTIGEIVAFQMYVFMLMMPISQIVQSWSDTQLALASLERTVDLLKRSVDKPDRSDALHAPSRVESLVFDNVSFGYEADNPVLHHVSFTIEAGQSVALVGRSGAGKSTVTNLVARFYDPQSGAIRLNGRDLRDFKLESYRSLMGMVQQDVFLFDGSIRENIDYGRRGATMDRIIDAAKRANAHSFISQFPGGYDSVIGERGIKLSGGQKQRISIARAILADPQILILDEATSNLDTESEQLIQASLVDLLSNRTTVVIAHRLSTVTRADHIIVMEAGKIIDAGTHGDLMIRCDLYHDMVERQMRLHADFLEPEPQRVDFA